MHARRGRAGTLLREGLATTQISLIRLHTEIIRPPRALWVPFELGRPLGVPNDPGFQRRVLTAALKLLEAPGGPVLEDFPEEAPASEDLITILSCPVSFTGEEADLTEAEQLCSALKRELASLRPWYDISVSKRGRTTVGVSKLEPDIIADFICSFLKDGVPENPREDIPIAYTLKLAVDDLKAFYFEGIMAQPGQESPSSKTLTDWFWNETVAAKAVLAVREACKRSQDGLLQIAGKALLVPIDVVRQKKK